MRRRHRIGIVVVIAVAAVPAAAAWIASAQAGVRQSAPTGSVSCTTLQGAMQISAYAYRPSVGLAGAFVFTGPPNSSATVDLLAVQTGASKLGLDRRCSRTKASARLAHHGLNSAGVVKAGYNQSPTVYCGVPGRILVRYRVGYASSGKPATASIAIWAKRKTSARLREIGYVQWSRARSTTYYAPKSCVSQ